MKCKNYDTNCYNCIGCDYIERSKTIPYTGFKWCYKDKNDNVESEIKIKNNTLLNFIGIINNLESDKHFKSGDVCIHDGKIYLYDGGKFVNIDPDSSNNNPTFFECPHCGGTSFKNGKCEYCDSMVRM